MSRVLVIGCGSIGSRRARLLAEMGHEVCVVDSDMGRAIAIAEEVPAVVALFPGGWPDFARRWGCEAFVCTPAETHLAVTREAVAAGIKGLFIEKPLSISMDGIPEVIAECERRDIVTMGACNMRWAYPHFSRSVMLTNRAPLSSWRTGAEAYREHGIILESLIHELDLARYWNGPIRRLTAFGDDSVSAYVTIEHEGGDETRIDGSWSEGAKPGRSASWDNVGVRLTHPADISDQMYRREMTHFIECVENGVETCNALRATAETLRWALHARNQLRLVIA